MFFKIWDKYLFVYFGKDREAILSKREFDVIV